MPIDKRIKCFIFCSTEDLMLADKIRHYLEYEGIPTHTWNESSVPEIPMFENLQNALVKYDLVISILPSFEERYGTVRDNYFFAMGMIFGMGKTVIALANPNSRQTLPVDLSSMMLLRYDPDDLKTTLRHIRNWAVHSFKNSI